MTETPAAAPLSESDERLYSMLSHIGVILFGFIPPLIFWLIGKDRSKFVDNQAKEALNFSILLLIVYIVSWILMFVIIGFVTYFAAWVLSIIWCIQAGLKANKGIEARYPVNLRIIK